MNTLLEVYRRFFRSHRWMLLVGTLLALVVSIEPVFIHTLNRYIIDEVLQVSLQGRPEVQHQPDLPTTGIRGHEPVVRVPSSGDIPTITDMAAPTSDTFIEPQHSLQDQIEAMPGKSRHDKTRAMGFIVLMYIIMHITVISMRALMELNYGRIAERAVFRMRRHIHEKLLRLQLTYHDQHQSGRLLSRAIDDVRHIQMWFAPLLGNAMGMITLFALSVSLAFWIHAKMALAALIVMPFFAVTYESLRTRLRTMKREARHQNSRVYGLIRDRIANPRVVKSFVQEKREQIRFHQQSGSLLRMMVRNAITEGTLTHICNAISAVGMAGVFAYGVHLTQSGQLSVGYLLFFYGTVQGMYTPIVNLSHQMMVFQWVQVACQRIMGVLDEPVTINDREDAIDLGNIEGAIEFNDVTMTYDGKPTPALQDINLRIDAGMHVCITGPSGAGKSSLAAALLRLYEPQQGTITIDGTDLQGVKLSSIRRQVAYVPQEPLLFSGTLEQNIRYGNPFATKEEIVRAAAEAEIHDFIQTQDHGYQTVVGENGLRLSGGQKQRMSLARALLTNPSVLILDDCTSALDAHTEARIQQTLRSVAKGRTVIAVSHRVSMTSKADMIVVMEAGRIVETGTHDELMQQGGNYAKLVADQMRDVQALPDVEDNADDLAVA